MKINKIYISGYRGFDNFSIENVDLPGLTILAGQNGTGKSTILEVIAYLLNSSDRGQISDPNIINSVTSDKAIWEIECSLSEKEIDHIVRALSEQNLYDRARKEKIKIRLLKDLEKSKDSFLLILRVVIEPEKINPLTGEGISFEFGSSRNHEIPHWLELIRSNQIVPLATYVKDFEGIGELGSTYLASRYFDPELAKFTNTGIDLRNRNTRTTINLKLLFDRLALADLWDFFKIEKGKFSGLKVILETINEVINPLEISYDEKEAENGYMQFVIHNRKTDRSYPLQFASSGEKQIMGLVGLLLNWEKQPFKPIILIDEPDVHLHPAYTIRLAKFINKLFKNQSNFTSIIATHSPEFIGENTNSVYQIAPNSKNIEKVQNLTERKNLLSSLGKKFDLAYLAPKVVFVEGTNNSENQLEDTEVYRRLIDPEENKVVFLPAASKAENKIAREFTEFFFNKISQETNTFKIFALVDGDNELTEDSTTVFKTPYYCVENLFLMDIKAIIKAIEVLTGKSKKEDIVDKIISESIIKSGGDILTTDGKKTFGIFFGELRKLDSKINNKKELQQQILNNTQLNRLPEKVQIFLGSFINEDRKKN